MSNYKLPFSYSHFGVNDYDFWFHLRPLEETELIFEYGSKMITDAGIHWDRVHLPGIFSWNVMEPVKGKYDWTIPDLLVRTAQKYNINLLPNIWPFAAWDQKAWEGKNRKKIDSSLAEGKNWPVDDSYPIPPRYDKPHDVESCSRWIKNLVERYDGDGIDDMPGLKYPIKYWEPGNEPFGFFFWPTSDHNSFAEFTKMSYLAAKNADPTCKILVGGGDFYPMERFFRAIIELGKKDGQNYFDIINLHIPSIRGAKEMLKNDIPKNIYLTKKLLAEYNLDIPIWFTEFGTHVGSERRFRKKKNDKTLPHPPPLPFQREEEQAEYFIKGTCIAFKEGVEKIFWQGVGPIRPPNTELTSPIPESFLSSYSQTCLLDPEGKARLIYQTLSLFVKIIEPFEIVEKLEFGEGIEVYDYHNGLFVAWSDNRKTLVLNDLKEGNLTVIKTIPKPYSRSPGSSSFEKKNSVIQFIKIINGKAKIRLSRAPVIIKIKPDSAEKIESIK